MNRPRPTEPGRPKIRSIPTAMLCPACGLGRLRSYGSNSLVEPGPHRVLLYRQCDRCGARCKIVEDRVGIVILPPEAP